MNNQTEDTIPSWLELLDLCRNIDVIQLNAKQKRLNKRKLKKIKHKLKIITFTDGVPVSVSEIKAMDQFEYKKEII